MTLAKPPDAPAVLAQLRATQTLEHGYEAWSQLREQRAAALSALREKARALDEEGEFLLGAVRSAGEVPASGEAGLVRERDAFLGQARARLDAARAELAAQEAQARAAFAAAEEACRSELAARVDRYLARARPRLKLLRRPAGAGRTILHAERVSPDEAVLLLRLFTGAIPSRYGFLADDSTDDALLPPTLLYADDEAARGQLRPDAGLLRARLEAAAPVQPVKGFLPVWVPVSDGAPALYRLLSRGVVLEVELADGAGFRNVLTREEAERFAGHLVRLKLEGKLELEL